MLVLNNFKPSHITASAFSSKSSQDITVPANFSYSYQFKSMKQKIAKKRQAPLFK